MGKNFCCNFDYPVVETVSGKIRGYQLNDIFYFRGVEYATAQRFMLPEPVMAWDGIKPAYTYGPNPPVTNRPKINAFDPAFQFRYWPESEKCLTLNIWTPEINGSADRPVMVWIHGGSLSFGSATELVGYEADRMSKDENIVMVSVNHRLNLLGYMNLTEYGERYSNSGTVGMMDLVESLRWIKNNISHFGGDPNNVTIVGHSGGGAKVRTLLQMPEAACLCSKAIIHSGLRYKDIRFRSAEQMQHDSATTAAAILKELGIDKTNISKIETIPYSQIAKAFRKVEPDLHNAGIVSMWSPIPDKHFPGDYTNVGLSEKAKKTPMLVGCTFGEMNLDKGKFYNRTMDDSELNQIIFELFGDEGEKLTKMFAKSFPYKSKIDLLYMDSTYRIGSTDFMNARVSNGAYDSYMFMLTYNFKLFGGFPAWHGSDLPFLFKSYDRIPVYNEPGAQYIGEKFNSYVAEFARTGKPESPNSPVWDKFTTEGNDTMIFDDKPFMSTDISHEMMKIHDSICPRFSLNFSSDEGEQ